METALYPFFYLTARAAEPAEEYIADYQLVFIIDGKTTLNVAGGRYDFKQGDVYLLKNKQYISYVTDTSTRKGRFEAIKLSLTQDLLKEFFLHYKLEIPAQQIHQKSYYIQKSPLFKNYINSVLCYFAPGISVQKDILRMKAIEALLLLIQTDHEMTSLLFNFSELNKQELKAFMDKYYHCNETLEKFAFLTGRSLATFNKDFRVVYQEPPGKWLQKKRLDVAYQQIIEGEKQASDIYAGLGFESLSHFSTAFKREFGCSPTHIFSLKQK